MVSNKMVGVVIEAVFMTYQLNNLRRAKIEPNDTENEG